MVLIARPVKFFAPLLFISFFQGGVGAYEEVAREIKKVI